MIFRQGKVIQFNGAVVSDLASSDKFSAIRELVNKASVFSRLKKPSEFINAIYQREQEKTTGFGHGIAVAHGKVASVGKITIALGISKKGILYNAADGKPVHLLFLIASPPDKSQEYLKTLASLMVIMRDENLRHFLIKEESVSEIESILNNLFRKIYNERCSSPRR